MQTAVGAGNFVGSGKTVRLLCLHASVSCGPVSLRKSVGCKRRKERVAAAWIGVDRMTASVIVSPEPRHYYSEAACCFVCTNHNAALLRMRSAVNKLSSRVQY